MSDFYTYIYYDPSRNNEPIYIGKGKEDRAWIHIKREKKHPFVNRLKYMAKNNIKPIIGIINCKDEEEAFSLEMWFIYKFGRKDLCLGTLLNLTDGGDGASNPSEETRYKIGSAKRGKKESKETKDKKSESLMGHVVTSETKKKQSIAKAGKIPAAVELRRSYKGASNPQYGKIWNEEKRNKMSKTNSGRKRSYREDGTWFFVYPDKIKESK